MIDTVYVVRHGKLHELTINDASIVARLSNVNLGFRLNWVTHVWKSVTGLPRDPPLAAFGETQAQELADYFLSLPEDERPTAIFSSPYYRCLQTSKPVSIALNVPIYVEHGVSEWYSPVQPGTGLHPRPAAATELQRYFPEIDPSWRSIYYASRKGEDVEQCHERAEGLLEALVPEVERRYNDRHRRILLISHAATIIAVNRAFMGDRNAPMRIGCCTLSEFRRNPEATKVVGGWDAVKLADGSHLKDGANRDWGFEDIVIAGGKVIDDCGQPGTENEVDEPVGLQLRQADNTARM